MKARAKELGIPGIRVNSAGCLDRCEFGPVMVIYPEGIWYRAETREDIDEILQTHVIGHGRVHRLMLTEADLPPGKG
ncbi:(2Fe-2S) ferredoxin domain-containing protein [Roseomonas indoligenes]